MRRITIPRRLTTALAMGLLALLITAVPTLAGVTWCRADPIVQIGNEQVQIWVAVPEQYTASVTGPIDVTIYVPGNVSTEVLFLDAGFNGYGEKVTFIKSGSVLPNGAMMIAVIAKVPMSGTMGIVPVQMEIIHDGTSQFFSGNQFGTTAKMLIS